MKTKKGFSLTEILIVLSIVGILAMVGFVSSSNIKVKQEEHAAIAMLRQSIAAAATNSASKGRRLSLVYRSAGNKIVLEDESFNSLGEYKLPNSVSTDLDNGDRLEFTPLGWVDSNSLSGSGGFPNPITVSTTDKDYHLTISLIAEVRAEVF